MSLRYLGGTNQSTGQRLKPITPFSDVNCDDPEELLQWLTNAFEVCEDFYWDRNEQMYHNLCLFHGTSYDFRVRRASLDSDERYSKRKRRKELPEITVNDLRDFVRNRVAKMARFRPTTTLIPATGELNDKLAKDSVKMVLETIEYQLGDEAKQRKIDEYTVIFGEAFQLFKWDESLGDVHPTYKGREGEKIPKLDDEGKPIPGEYLNPKGEEIRTGDINEEIPLPTEVYLEPRYHGDPKWRFRYTYIPVEEVRSEYPEHYSKISATDKQQVLMPNLGKWADIEDHVLCIEFLHASTPELPKGKLIKFCPDLLFTKPENNPYKDVDSKYRNLAMSKMTDIDIPGLPWGFSSFQSLEDIQHQMNKLWKLAFKNLYLGANKTLFVPHNSVNINALKNGDTIVSYKGPQPPSMPTITSVAPDIFAMMELSQKKFDQIANIHAISKGELPSNVKSGKQIELLEEIEAQRATTIVRKKGNFIVDVSKQRLAIAAQFYSDDDKRLIRIIGKDRKELIRPFKVSDLNKPCDIRVVESSALPKSPSAKSEKVLDMFVKINSIPPGQDSRFPVEWAMELSELPQPEKFISRLTAAITAAEGENEDLTSGAEVMEPEQFEDHLQHWNVHFKFMQSRAFKELPKEKKKQMEEHVSAHEMFMSLSVTNNPFRLQQFLLLPGWPLYFELPAEVGQAASSVLGVGGEQEIPSNNEQ